MISLKPQDLLVVLRLAVTPSAAEQTIAALAQSVGLSASETHAAKARGVAATLLNPADSRPRIANLLEFLEHGLRYVFIPRRGQITRGVPTAHSTPPLSLELASAAPSPRFAGALSSHHSLLDVPVVWPHPEGELRGETLEPIYPSAVDVARCDRDMHEVLALTDALRIGTARERSLAIDLLSRKLRSR